MRDRVYRRLKACVFVAGLLSACPGLAHSQPKGDAAMYGKISEDVLTFLGAHRPGHQCVRHPERAYRQVQYQMILTDDPFGVDVGKGRKRYSGGRAQDWGESAAALYDPAGRMLAVAFNGCEFTRTAVGRVPFEQVYIYVKDGPGKAANVAAFEKWRGHPYGPVHVTVIP